MPTGPVGKRRGSYPNVLIKNMDGRGWKLNPIKVQGPFTLTKLLWFRYSEAYKNIPSKWKISCFILYWSLRWGGGGRDTKLGGRLWIVEAIYAFGLIRQTVRLSALRGVQTKKTLCSRTRLWFELPCYLGFKTQQILWYLKCPLQTEMLYRLWLFPIEWQCKFLRFERKTTTSSVTNYIPFAK